MNQIAPQFRAIAARRQAIQAELANLHAKVEALEFERGELEVAARVLHRLGLLVDETGPELPLPVAGGPDVEARPTVPDMIRDVISGFLVTGLPGATSQQILSEVNRRWGISDPNIVRPTLWRMIKSNRLAKHGDVYTLKNLVVASESLATRVPPKPVLRERSSETNDSAAEPMGEQVSNSEGVERRIPSWWTPPSVDNVYTDGVRPDDPRDRAKDIATSSSVGGAPR